MVAAELNNTSLVDWGIAGQPLPGQLVSGDVHVTRLFSRGALLALIDGVGHGDEATAAARVAADLLETHASESVISLVKRCHQALAKTRGAVMTLASLNAMDDTVTWIGVGNVEGRLMRAGAGSGQPAESVLLRNGLVGLQLPALQAAVLPLAPGDLLVFASDGIRTGFERGLSQDEPPRNLAAQILSRHFKGTDDALVLVARYLGWPRE